MPLDPSGMVIPSDTDFLDTWEVSPGLAGFRAGCWALGSWLCSPGTHAGVTGADLRVSLRICLVVYQKQQVVITETQKRIKRKGRIRVSLLLW